MVHNSSSRYIHCIAVVLALLLACVPAFGKELCKGVPFPPNLNPFLAAGELQLSSQYVFDVTQPTIVSEFELANESLVRGAIGPHKDSYDISMVIAKSVSGAPVISSDSRAPAMTQMFGVIPAGSYKLQLQFLRHDTSTSVDPTCIPAYISLAIAPKDIVASRASAFAASCPAATTVPSIDFSVVGKGQSIHYSSDADLAKGTVFAVIPSNPSTSAVDQFPQKYVFTVPSAGESSTAAFRAVLSEETVSSGFLRLLLQSNVSENPSQPTDLAKCIQTGDCRVSTPVRKNQQALVASLSPGTYALWFMYTENQVPTPVSCAPFALDIDIVPRQINEEIVTCSNGFPLPASMDDVAGDSSLFADNGYLYVKRDFILESGQIRRSTNMTIRKESFIRVRVDGHRTDLDILLSQFEGSEQSTVAYSGRSMGPEVIAFRAKPGIYNLLITAFGLGTATPCDTFTMELEIAPVSSNSHLEGICGISQTEIPDISGLSTLSSADKYTFKDSGKTFMFKFHDGADLSQKIITSQSFTIPKPMRAVIRLSSQFLFADVTFTLAADSNPLAVIHPNYHNRNEYVFDEVLPADTYTLTLATGFVQQLYIPKAADFSSCAPFSLAINVVAISAQSESDRVCGSAQMLPPSLNIPGLLGTSDVVHIFRDFRSPDVEQHGTTYFSRSKFTLRQKSLFRLNIPVSHLDIDANIYLDTVLIASSTHLTGEEDISVELDANKEYTLELRFYHWYNRNGVHVREHEDYICYIYSLEFSVTPLTVYGPSCSDMKLPSADFIPEVLEPPTGTGYFKSDKFWFRRYIGATDPTSMNIDFELKSLTQFRAILHFDSVYAPLKMSITSKSSSTERTALPSYDTRDTGTLLLAPGKYTIQISEFASPSELPNCMSTSCIPFYFEIGARLASDQGSGSSENPTELTCGISAEDSSSLLLLPLTATLNKPGFLHPLSGNAVYLSNKNLVNVKDRSSYVEFTINEPTLYKVYLPVQEDNVDVDIWLRSGTKQQPGSVVNFLNDVNDEAMTGKIAAGQYFFELLYTNVEANAQCLEFGMELALLPVSALSARPEIGTVCADEYPPALAEMDKDVTMDLKFSPVSVQKYNAKIEFDIANGKIGHLRADVVGDFVTAGLILSLQANIKMGMLDIDKTYYALADTDHTSLNVALWPGHYSIRVRDLTQLTSPTELKCASYSLSYHVTSDSDIDPGQCAEIETLPTDLYTKAGGSEAYGGLQLTDGSVYVSGEHFFIASDELQRSRWTSFRLYGNSFVRLSLKVSGRDDIDAYIYGNRTDSSSLIGSVLGTDDFDSGLFYLQPEHASAASPQLYDVKTYTYRYDDTIRCRYFRWALGVMPESTLHDLIKCPEYLPEEHKRVPPETIVVDKAVSVSSSNYIFTRAFVEQHSVLDFFRYRVKLDVKQPSQLYAAIQFNFFADDYRFKLRNFESGKVLAQGAVSSVSRMTTTKNVRSVIDSSVDAGVYTLDIEQDFLESTSYAFLEDEVPNYCSMFSFDFAATPTGTVDPSLTSVTPQRISDYEPCQNLVLTAYFSQTVDNVPSDSKSLIEWLQSNNAAVMREAGGDNVVLNNAVLSDDKKHIQLVFSKDSLTFGKSYVLTMKAEAFAHSGTPFKSTDTVEHVYNTTACDCSGHGTCQSPGPHGECMYCVCNDHWVGASCSACEDGFHPYNGTCVRNELCGPDACSGHGTCDNSTGTRVCICNVGYASSENAMCDRCAAGFTGYPQCVPDGSAVVPCAAPLLPTTLNTVTHLGWKGYTALSGEYYIDTRTLMHEMSFTLEEDSIFRVYIEDHHVDIDLWLYRVNEDGTAGETLVHRSNFGGEETAFLVLDGVKGLGRKYALKLQYYVDVNDVVGSCETFELELEIMRYAHFEENKEEWFKSTSQLNNSVLPSITENNIDKDFHYAPDQIFALLSDAHLKTAPNYFWSYRFTIAPVENHMPLLRTRVNSRFAIGQVALKLEEGNEGDHCANENIYTTLDQSRCVAGDSTMNGNYIERVVQPGKYILWLYEPLLQNATMTPCTRFDFAFHVEYVDSSNAFWECGLPELPPYLNADGYIHSDGSMHLFDSFHTSGESSTSFATADESIFRAASNNGVIFTLTDSSTKTALVSDAKQILITLPAGHYSLAMRAVTSSHPKCLTLDLELALEPTKAIVPQPCTEARLPTIEVGALPFHLGPSSIEPYTQLQFFAMPYSSGNTLVAQYSFHLSEIAVLSTELSSNFLYHDLGLELLESKSSSVIGSSQHKMNMQSLQQKLSAGDYTLRIVTPAVDGKRPEVLPTCVPFNLVMDIVSTNDNSTNTECMLVGDRIPVTFDDERFMNVHGTMEYGSSQLRIPEGTSLKRVVKIPFTTNRMSFMRVFVDSYSAADIDIAVMDEESGRIVAEGTNSLYVIETFATPLKASKFSLVLTFWIWDKQLLAPCSTFAMQVSISDLEHLTQGQKCATDEDKWPPNIGEVKVSQKKYSYHSLDTGDDLYFQQKANEVASWKSDFTVDAMADVAVDVSFDFERTDLVVSLMRMNGNDVLSTYYATTMLHHSFLMVRNLPVGSYRLMMYDPVALDASIRGCAHYTFSVDIEATSTLFTNDHATLPVTLNSVPYLDFDQSTDIFDTFVMFRFGDKENTTFSLTQDSTIRAEAQYELTSARSRDVQLVLYQLGKNDAREKVIAKYSTALYAHIGKGKYSLEFVQVNKSGSTSLTGEGEMIQTSISIHTVDELKKILEASPVPSSCEDVSVPSITPTPDGFFQYSSTDRQISQETLSASRTSGAPVQKLSIKLPQQSVVWVEIGTDFAMNALDIELERYGGEMIHSTMYRNLHTIRAVLPAGEHFLSIIAPGPFEDDLELLPRCTLFTFAVTLSPDDASSRCAFLDLVPWDLNRYDGGSLAYGGPIDASGVLSMYSGSFGVPDGHTTDSITMNIKQVSVVSVVLGVGARMTTISARLLEASTGNEVTPLTSSQAHNQKQVALLWKVEPEESKHTEYELILNYGGMSGACSSFEMQIKIQPLSLLQSSSVCPITGEMQNLPEKKLDIDAHGYASDYHNSWFYTNDSLVKEGVNTPYDIEFEVKTSSAFSVSFSFSSLVNMLDLTLWKRGDGEGAMIEDRSSLKSQRSMSGSTTATRSIVTTLTEGRYFLRLTSASFPSPLTHGGSMPELCLPFTYIVQLMPLDGTPYVSDVNPALARGLSPSKPLTLLLRFSEPIYDAVTSDRVEASAIKEVFGLSKPDEDLFAPESVAAASTDASMWALNFAASNFKSVSTYQLHFSGGDRLADDEGQNVSYTLINLYSTLDATCNGHGTLSNTTGECRCEEAYAGESCNTCNLGYMRVQGPDPDTVRCVPAVKCEEDTCGCSRGRGGKCNPLGTCYIDREDGRALCNCKEGYAGEYCRQCASGYHNWPNCAKCLNGGTWNKKNGNCDCPHNYKGDICNECAFGYSGKDCSANAIIPVLSLFAIVIAAAAAIAGVIGWNWYKKNRAPTAYEMVSTVEEEEEMGSTADSDKNSSSVIQGKMQKLDFGDEIEGDDAVEGGDPEVVSMGIDPEKPIVDEQQPSQAETKPKSQPVVDLFGDAPMDEEEDDAFFSFK